VDEKFVRAVYGLGKHTSNKKELCFRGYSIIGSGSGFTVNLGSDSLGKSND